MTTFPPLGGIESPELPVEPTTPLDSPLPEIARRKSIFDTNTTISLKLDEEFHISPQVSSVGTLPDAYEFEEPGTT